MPSPFQTEQRTLAQLFAGPRIFTFPGFQRPYRWSVDEALTLLDDVAQAALQREPGYFLGNLVLTREKGRRFFVIDGRQRLTTLFILICVLRDLETDMPRKRGLHRILRDPGNLMSREKPSWRLDFPADERPFIEAMIANPKRIDTIPDNVAFISERLGGMLEVADAFRERLGAPPGDTGLPRLDDLTDYLLHQCEVIILTATSSSSGLRLFQVLNNRGLQLSEADLIKPELLNALPSGDQHRAAHIWDGLEDQLGTEHLDTFLRSYVFIQSGDWLAPGQDFTEALKASMMSRGPHAFHFEDMQSYGAAFAEIHWNDIDFDNPEKNPNSLLTGLSALGRNISEWKEFLPVAMEILVRFEDDEDRIFELFCALDRAFFTWFINDTPEAARRNLVYRMIMEMREGTDPLAPGGSMRTPERELEKAFQRLTLPFSKLHQRGALTRRIELALCMQAGKTPPQHLEQTIAEQILPRNPRPGSQWMIDFKRQEFRDTVDLLGNCMPLSRDLARKAGNKDFALKLSDYTRAGADRYFLSVKDVCRYPKWTPESIHERTERLAGLLRECWAQGPHVPYSPPTDDFDDEDYEDADTQLSQEDTKDS